MEYLIYNIITLPLMFMFMYSNNLQNIALVIGMGLIGFILGIKIFKRK